MSSASDSIAQRRRELEQRLAELSPAKRALLDRAPELLDRSLTAPASAPIIAPRAAGVPVPMSFVQELVWLLEQVNPGSVYNVPRLVRLRGQLDVPALRQALDALVARHEVLRSTFDAVDGEPRQIVHEPRAVHVAEADLRTDSERETNALVLVRELARRPFDLASDLQLRATIIRIADDDQLLLLESHHVASDEWSRNILLRELAMLYAGFRKGASVVLPPLTIQYGDYAVWQRETLSGAVLDKLLSYWRGCLAGVPALLELPADRPRTTSPSFDGALASVDVPRATLEGLRRVSQANGTTLFMTLLAAVSVLLARWSGQQDVMIGSPIAGRVQPETHDVMGYFTNMLVLRTQWEGDPTFIELLAHVRDVALGAYEHQDLPYEKLVLEIQRKQPDGAPQLQVQFTLQDPGRESFTLDGTTAVPFARLGGVSKLEISLSMLEQSDGSGLRALAEYRTDLFDESTITRLLRQLDTLLAAIAAKPAARVSELPMLSVAERTTVLDDFNRTDAAVGGPMLLHERISEQASRTPLAIAVSADLPDGSTANLTFGELVERAHTLARHLRTLGVGPGRAVAIHADRSPELVVAMLGVLEAGAYYVPLDPDYPADRVSFMLVDSAVDVLLSVSRVRQVSSGGTTGPTVVLLDTGWAQVEASVPDANDELPSPAGPDDVAYMIYTSGSTGRPKGVLIPHRAVVNYLAWMQGAYDVGASDRILQKAPASFDACIWEFFLPLVSGARLVLARPGGQQDPAYLLDAIDRHEITLLQLVPSQLRMMLDFPGSDGVGGLPRLRRLFLGGEALPSELLTRVTAACPALPITNLYGPTEATVYATHWDVPVGSWREGDVVSIGQPVANTRIIVLDSRAKLVPIGVAGELCIGGAQLARGYWQRAELTAEKFVECELDGRAMRLYRTGDRARWRADGRLEYLGRLDFQVKLRGFRIELGEIETLLAAQPEVQSAAVLVREDSPGDQRLVAYCLPADGVAVEAHAEHARALRERLKVTLPVFMVPSMIVWLERWPMNANGKLDRNALPVPGAADAPAVATAQRAPETAVEEIVAGVWSEVLDLERVGTEHDFFDLGGHSLLAMQAAARIGRLFGRRITLRAFFQHSTICTFAAALVAEEPTPGRTDAVARALIRLRDMTPEERERRRAVAAASQKNPGTRDGHE